MEGSDGFGWLYHHYSTSDLVYYKATTATKTLRQSEVIMHQKLLHIHDQCLNYFWMLYNKAL